MPTVKIFDCAMFAGTSDAGPRAAWPDTALVPGVPPGPPLPAPPLELQAASPDAIRAATHDSATVRARIDDVFMWNPNL